MSNQYKREDFLGIAKEKPEETKTILRDQMNYTEVGVVEMHTQSPEKTGKFFKKLIGKDFDPADEGHITLVLEAVQQNPEVMADACMFAYETFGDEKEATKKTKAAKSEKKERKASGPRVKTDWAAQEIPFKEGTSQHITFTELLNFKGNLKAFITHMEKIVAEKSIQTRSTASLVNTAIAVARERGWKVDVKHGDDKVIFAQKAS